jgi:hypothetical protein
MRTAIPIMFASLLLLAARASAAAPRDEVLEKMKRALPAGWRALVEGERLVLERQQPVLALPDNKISAPVSTETAAQRAERFRRHGKSVRPRVIFRIAPRWSAAKLAAARRANEAADREQRELATKHKVEALLAAALRRKPGLPVTGANAEEKRRLAAYLAAKAELDKRRQQLPDHHTTRWSLFFERREGWSDAFTSVHPAEAAQECYRVEREARALLAP